MPHVVLHNRLSVSVAIEILSCLNNDCGVQLGTRLVLGPGSSPAPDPRGHAARTFFSALPPWADIFSPFFGLPIHINVLPVHGIWIWG